MDRFLPHIELLQEFYRSRAIAFGSEADLLHFAETLSQVQVVQDELASILRSVLYAEGLVLDRTELLELLCASLGGSTSMGEANNLVPSRELVLFVNRTVRSVQSDPAHPRGDLSEAEASPWEGAHSRLMGPSPWGKLPAAEIPHASAPALFPRGEAVEGSTELPFATHPQNGARKSLSSAIQQAMENGWHDDAPVAESAPWEQPLPPRATYADRVVSLPEADLPASGTVALRPAATARRSALRQPALWCGVAAIMGFALGALLPRSHSTRPQHAQALSPTAESRAPATAAATPTPPGGQPEARPTPPPAATSPVTCVLAPGGAADTAVPTLPKLNSPTTGQPIPSISTAAACNLLLTAVPPVYPTLAALTQLQGAVSLELVISPQGTVRVGSVLSGPALLRGAAEQAVRQWRFRPFLQGGHAIEVATPVTVAFHAPPPAETPAGPA